MGTTTLQELLALPGPERLELAMSLWQSLDAAEQITLKVRRRVGRRLCDVFAQGRRCQGAGGKRTARPAVGE
jgi:hypothetical protein